ncbi:MAG TPA: chaperone modulator CbpM [Sandaracinaceae bacterium LLY-WYZ-13_1]|nr:chaperone modulator CbpM [Sandaracinaceae bacterium LLY-WYZ-13_1]
MTSGRISRVQIAKLLELEEGFVVELEQHELIAPDREGFYDPGVMERVRVCWTMHHALGVNMPGLEVALNLLERLQGERRRTHELLARLRDELDR